MTDSGSVDMGSIPVGGTNYSFKRLTYNKLSVCFFSTGTTQVKHGIFVFSKNLSSDSPVIFRRIT